MEIDITKAPKTTADIERERVLLNYQIPLLKRKINALHVIFLLTAILTMLGAIIGNEVFQWLPWRWAAGIFLLLCPFAALFSPHGAFAGMIIGAAIGMVVSGHNEPASIAAMAVGIVVCAMTGAAVSYEVKHLYTARLRDAQKNLELLEHAPKEDCLKIVDWLGDQAIAAFRGAVQAQGRLFTVGEVAAMEAYFESRDVRQKEQEHQRAVDEACRRVYLGNLL